MIYIITHDYFFLCGIRAAVADKQTMVVTIAIFSEERDFSQDIFIIDTMDTGCFSPQSVDVLVSVRALKIIFFSGLKTAGLHFLSPVCFISRRAGVGDITGLLNGGMLSGVQPRLPAFRRRDLEVARLLILVADREHIISATGLSAKMLDMYKYRLMLILRLKKMYLITRLPVAGHLVSTEERRVEEEIRQEDMFSLDAGWSLI